MKWKNYFFTLGIIIILRILDLFITYSYTPDLQQEWNPLVSLFGFSWAGLLFTQLLIVTFVGILMFFYFSHPPRQKKIVHGLSFNDFIYIYFFGKILPWPQRLFALPSDPKKHLHFNGFILMFITISVSIFAIINNLLIIFNVETYIYFVMDYAHSFFPICFAALILISAQIFFCIEYRKYRKTSFTADTATTRSIGGLDL